MEERREREQYFFDPPTIRRLADFLEDRERPLCLCAPTVGEELCRRGVPVTILDIDRRFAGLPGFRVYDLHRPRWLGEEYGIVLCDPPFFGVSLTRLRQAVEVLARHDPRQPLLVTWLSRRREKFLGVFHGFGLVPTGFMPGYATVPKLGKFEVELFGNLPPEAHARLRA